MLLVAATSPAAAQESPPPDTRRLPFLAEEARKRGIELPRPFGIGVVYYHLDRAIEIRDVRVGRDGAPPTSVSQFAQLSALLFVTRWLLPK